jgi:hypothetical protein
MAWCLIIKPFFALLYLYYINTSEILDLTEGSLTVPPRSEPPGVLTRYRWMDRCCYILLKRVGAVQVPNSGPQHAYTLPYGCKKSILESYFFLMFINKNSWFLILRNRLRFVIKGSMWVASSGKYMQSKVQVAFVEIIFLRNLKWSSDFFQNSLSFVQYVLYSSLEKHSIPLWHVMEFKIVKMLHEWSTPSIPVARNLDESIIYRITLLVQQNRTQNYGYFH